MFGSHACRFELPTPRCRLRLARHADCQAWRNLRRKNSAFLAPWEPSADADQYTKSAFKARVHWSRHSFNDKKAVPLLIFRNADNVLLGGVTLDNIRYGPVLSGVLGYWMGQEFTRQGYMHEAINALIAYAFAKLNLSRIEAATLPDNQPSRALLEKCGFKYEGVAQNYYQINGRWHAHVLYAKLRADRRASSTTKP